MYEAGLGSRLRDRALFESAALTLGEATPNAKAFVLFEGVLQALHPHVT